MSMTATRRMTGDEYRKALVELIPNNGVGDLRFRSVLRAVMQKFGANDILTVSIDRRAEFIANLKNLLQGRTPSREQMINELVALGAHEWLGITDWNERGDTEIKAHFKLSVIVLQVEDDRDGGISLDEFRREVASWFDPTCISVEERIKLSTILNKYGATSLSGVRPDKRADVLADIVLQFTN